MRKKLSVKLSKGPVASFLMKLGTSGYGFQGARLVGFHLEHRQV
jgi:hypothetical protein